MEKTKSSKPSTPIRLNVANYTLAFYKPTSYDYELAVTTRRR